MSMTYIQLLNAQKSDIETIRKQKASYSRNPLSDAQLDAFRNHLKTLYTGNVQLAFAYRIYMKAA